MDIGQQKYVRPIQFLCKKSDSDVGKGGKYMVSFFPEAPLNRILLRWTKIEKGDNRRLYESKISFQNEYSQVKIMLLFVAWHLLFIRK